MSKTVLIVQTCDGVVYKDMCDLSEPVNRAYAKRHGYSYRRYDGIRRGVKPAQSTFNRMYLIDDALKDSSIDWVLYMDADAVVIDHEKTVDEFLMDQYAVVACRGGSDEESNYADLNAGVAFYNLKHPELPKIVQTWKSTYERFPLYVLESWEFQKATTFNGQSFWIDDQLMLSQILYSYSPPVSFMFKGDRHNAFNYEGPFIHQKLRCSGTMEQRINNMKETIRKIPNMDLNSNQNST